MVHMKRNKSELNRSRPNVTQQRAARMRAQTIPPQPVDVNRAGGEQSSGGRPGSSEEDEPTDRDSHQKTVVSGTKTSEGIASRARGNQEPPPNTDSHLRSESDSSGQELLRVAATLLEVSKPFLKRDQVSQTIAAAAPQSNVRDNRTDHKDVAPSNQDPRTQGMTQLQTAHQDQPHSYRTQAAPAETDPARRVLSSSSAGNNVATSGQEAREEIRGQQPADNHMARSASVKLHGQTSNTGPARGPGESQYSHQHYVRVGTQAGYSETVPRYEHGSQVPRQSERDNQTRYEHDLEIPRLERAIPTERYGPSSHLRRVSVQHGNGGTDEVRRETGGVGVDAYERRRDDGARGIPTQHNSQSTAPAPVYYAGQHAHPQHVHPQHVHPQHVHPQHVYPQHVHPQHVYPQLSGSLRPPLRDDYRSGAHESSYPHRPTEQPSSVHQGARYGTSSYLNVSEQPPAEPSSLAQQAARHADRPILTGEAQIDEASRTHHHIPDIVPRSCEHDIAQVVEAYLRRDRSRSPPGERIGMELYSDADYATRMRRRQHEGSPQPSARRLATHRNFPETGNTTQISTTRPDEQPALQSEQFIARPAGDSLVSLNAYAFAATGDQSIRPPSREPQQRRSYRTAPHSIDERHHAPYSHGPQPHQNPVETERQEWRSMIPDIQGLIGDVRHAMSSLGTFLSPELQRALIGRLTHFARESPRANHGSPMHSGNASRGYSAAEPGAFRFNDRQTQAEDSSQPAARSQMAYDRYPRGQPGSAQSGQVVGNDERSGTFNSSADHRHRTTPRSGNYFMEVSGILNPEQQPEMRRGLQDQRQGDNESTTAYPLGSHIGTLPPTDLQGSAAPPPYRRGPGRPRKDDPNPPTPRRKTAAPLPGEKPHVGRPSKKEIAERQKYQETIGKPIPGEGIGATAPIARGANLQETTGVESNAAIAHTTQTVQSQVIDPALTSTAMQEIPSTQTRNLNHPGSAASTEARSRSNISQPAQPVPARQLRRSSRSISRQGSVAPPLRQTTTQRKTRDTGATLQSITESKSTAQQPSPATQMKSDEVPRSQGPAPTVPPLKEPEGEAGAVTGIESTRPQPLGPAFAPEPQMKRKSSASDSSDEERDSPKRSKSGDDRGR